MEVRPEQPGDVAAIRDVHARAFAVPEGRDSIPIEVRLVDDLRAGPAWLPALSLVAVLGNGLVGHVVCTRGRVDQEPVLALGPIGVAPPSQGRGIGSELMRKVIDRADSLGESLVGLVGEPGFYARFGFVAGSTLSIDSPHPDWGDHFQVCRLTGYRPTVTGHFEYPPEFGIS